MNMKKPILKLFTIVLFLSLNFSVVYADVDENSVAYDNFDVGSEDDSGEEKLESDDFMDQSVGALNAEVPEDPEDGFTSLLSNVAENYGLRTEVEGATYNQSELDLNYVHQELGYSRGGMESTLQRSIVVNSLVDRLFKKYESSRDVKGFKLPGEFSILVRYLEGYIKGNAKRDAESVNGLNHHNLAIQVLRASFCFGNDPFMIASKMRRETGFRRLSISPTGAVGFSQMTGDGIAEVKDQMAVGGQRIVNKRTRMVSMPNARSEFLQSIRCFSGLEQNQWTFPSGTNEQIKARLRNSWAWDMIFGQTMIKAIVSWAMASGQFADTVQGKTLAYRETFARYNGDDQPTQPICMRAEVLSKMPAAQRSSGLVPSVPMRDEYACDSILQFQRMSDQWNTFNRKNNQERRIVIDPVGLGDYG
jgi:hypothetical protein